MRVGTFNKILPRVHDTPTVGECDVNSDSGRSGVDSTVRGRQSVHMASVIYSRRRLATVDGTRRAAVCTARRSILDWASNCGSAAARREGKNSQVWGLR